MIHLQKDPLILGRKNSHTFLFWTLGASLFLQSSLNFNDSCYGQSCEQKTTSKKSTHYSGGPIGKGAQRKARKNHLFGGGAKLRFGSSESSFCSVSLQSCAYRYPESKGHHNKELGSVKDKILFILHHPSSIHLNSYGKIPYFLQKGKDFLRSHGYTVVIEEIGLMNSGRPPQESAVPYALFWSNHPERKWLFMTEVMSLEGVKGPRAFLSSRGGNGGNFLWDFFLNLYSIALKKGQQTKEPLPEKKSFLGKLFSKKSPYKETTLERATEEGEPEKQALSSSNLLGPLKDFRKSFSKITAENFLQGLQNQKSPCILVGSSDHSALTLSLLPLGGYGIHAPGLLLSKEIRSTEKRSHLLSPYKDVLGLTTGTKKGSKFFLSRVTPSKSQTTFKPSNSDEPQEIAKKLGKSSGVLITNLTILEDYLNFLFGLEAFYALKKTEEESPQEKKWIKASENMRKQFINFCRHKILFVEDTGFQPYSFLRTLEKIKPFLGIFSGVVFCSFGLEAKEIQRGQEAQKKLIQYWMKDSDLKHLGGGGAYNKLPPIFMLYQSKNPPRPNKEYIYGSIGHGESLGACFQGNVKISCQALRSSWESDDLPKESPLVLTVHNPLT
jgi:muramoyltetrapeptide carboxypeptidase LdcA involved in peptidoglycan recycling